MKFGWQKEEELLLRSMKISPLKKLQWLEQMHAFTRRFMPKSQRKIWWKLREMRRGHRCA